MEQQEYKPIKLDTIDLLILQLLYDQDNDPIRKSLPRYSLTEINEAVPAVRSIATIHARMVKLEEAGLIHQPRKKVPRSRTITERGTQMLKEHLYGTPTGIASHSVVGG